MAKVLFMMVLLSIGAYLMIQGVRCRLAVQRGNNRLKEYQAENMDLS